MCLKTRKHIDRASVLATVLDEKYNGVLQSTLEVRNTHKRNY